MSMLESLSEQVYVANIAVHQHEAPIYDLMHAEIYSTSEQKRIYHYLQAIDKEIRNNTKQALDFGAGTGNITGKLLVLGYNVTAVDISPDMCHQLERKFSKFVQTGQLKIVNSKIEDFNAGKYDLITCYSVLHHLPDYTQTIQQLGDLLKSNGIMCLDHEASPYVWLNQKKNFFKKIYGAVNAYLNMLYFQYKHVHLPHCKEYPIADYWTNKDHHIESAEIQAALSRANLHNVKRVDYHLSRCWLPNPLFPFYRLFSKPDVSCWIAKK